MTHTDSKRPSPAIQIPDITPFQKFFKKVVSGSFLIFAATISALIWANISPASYTDFWHTEVTFTLGDFYLSKSLSHWIEEALMVLFFFTVGLEIKREILVGELANIKKALLPIAAAIGGMIFPAVIYTLLNHGTPGAHGWGIPMATDIAFSLAVLAILGSRVPFGIKIFLSAFAIVDDLGAVLVIAIFYTQTIAWSYIFMSLIILLGLFIANLMWIRHPLIYALLGICLWISILGSGIHATFAGVLVAMFIPAKGKYDTATFMEKVRCYLNDFECSGECGYTILLDEGHQNAVHNIEESCHDVETPLQRLYHGLNQWVIFLILPLFAIAHAGVSIGLTDIQHAVTHTVTLGIILGLCIGKPVGISLFTFLAMKLFNAPLMSGITFRHIVGAGMLGGIGFTMSLFISGLSFSSPELIEFSKLGILSASTISGITGLLLLRR